MRRAPASVHAIAAAELAGSEQHLREMFALRLDRWWEDLHDGLAAVYPDDAATRWPTAGRAGAAGRSSTATPSCAARPAPHAGARLVPVAGRARLRRLRRPVRAATCRACARQIPYLRELGVTYLHLMPLLPPRRATTTAATRSPTTAPSGRTSGTIGGPAGAGRRHCARPASAWCWTWCSTTSRGSTPGPKAPATATRRYRDVLLRLPRPDDARRLRADAAGGVPRLRPRQLHLRRRPRRPGCGRRSTPSSGTSTGPTRTSSSSTPTSCCSWPISGWRCCGWTRSRSCGSGSAPTRQNQPEVHAHHPGAARGRPDRLPGVGFQGRGDRRPARPGALPGQGLHHGKVSDLAYHNTPDGADLVDARGAGRGAGRAGAARRCPPRLPPRPG